MDKQQADRIEQKLDMVIAFIEQVSALASANGLLSKFKAARKVGAVGQAAAGPYREGP